MRAGDYFCPISCFQAFYIHIHIRQIHRCQLQDIAQIDRLFQVCPRFFDEVLRQCDIFPFMLLEDPSIFPHRILVINKVFPSVDRCDIDCCSNAFAIRRCCFQICTDRDERREEFRCILCLTVVCKVDTISNNLVIYSTAIC